MSDREIYEDDLGAYSVDDETQLQPEDTLLDRGTADLLDEGYSPPEAPRGVDAHGTTVSEQRTHETIEVRVSHEEIDPYAHLGTQDEYDPAAVDDEDDPDHQVGRRRAGRLVGADNGLGIDDEPVATDVGIDGAGSSAEEAAMHVMDPDDLRDGEDEQSDDWEAPAPGDARA